MADSLDEKHNESGTNLAADSAATKAAEERRAAERRDRIRKMRGWLSPRDSEVDDFGPEDAALYYGEGHNGWNR